MSGVLERSQVMKTRKMQILALATMATVMAVPLSLYVGDAGARQLSDRQMSRILGRADECYCNKTGLCKVTCAGDDQTCSGCDGISCTTMRTTGTTPTCCYGSSPSPPMSCDKLGQVTCTTTITCKTENIMHFKCVDGACQEAQGFVCPMCGNGGATHDKLDTYVCQASY
jgi:hypothetical protein